MALFCALACLSSWLLGLQPILAIGVQSVSTAFFTIFVSWEAPRACSHLYARDQIYFGLIIFVFNHDLGETKNKGRRQGTENQNTFQLH